MSPVIPIHSFISEEGYEPGDWLTQAENPRSEYGLMVQGRTFYKFVGISDNNLPGLLAHPIYDSHPPADENKRPYYLLPQEWRKATPEEIAEVIATRITGPKPS